VLRLELILTIKGGFVATLCCYFRWYCVKIFNSINFFNRNRFLSMFINTLIYEL